MTNDKDVLTRTALEQAELIRKREISSEELTRIYLARIARLNPELTAFVEVAEERAVREARARDKEVRRGITAPFLGVPMGIKDLNLARGTMARFGSRAIRFFCPFDDATTAMLRKGGFVMVGKTATSELGTLPVVEPDIHPPTRNPWDPRVTAGGSSGGAGAAVAAGMLPIAQGSDGAGSIRIPASFNHLYGIKPSRGRVANPFGFPDEHVLYTMGPLARTVDDAAAMLDVMAGITVGTPHWAPPPIRPFAELAKRTPPRLRVKLTLESSLVRTEPDIREATLRVAKVLSDLGHDVVEVGMPAVDVEEFLPVWQYTAARAPVLDWSLAQPVTRWLKEKGEHITEDEVIARTKELAGRVFAWFGDADLVVTPTVAISPPAIGAWKELSPAEVFAEAAKLGPFTAPFNVSGQPAASVPVGLSAKGYPIGVQLAGKPLGDALVLQVSRQIEEAMPWKARLDERVTR